MTAAGCGSTTPLSPDRTPLGGAPISAFTISGVVFGVTPDDREPLAGASVTSYLGRVFTDAEGYYEIRGESNASSIRVTVSKPGYTSVDRSVALASTVREDIDLAGAGTATLSGVIFETTAAGPVPAQGVLVEIASCFDTPGCAVNIEKRMTTDSTGAYRFTGLFAGTRSAPLWLSRNGDYYQDMPPEATACDGCFRLMSVNGDTHVDIVLPPRS